MKEEEFQSKVLTGVETLTKDFDRLQKETKTAFEDLTKVKNNMNSIADFEAKLKKVEIAMRREQRMAFGDPIRRISSDPEKRGRFNAAVRRAMNQDGDLDKVIKGIITKALGEDSSPGSTLIDDELANEIYDTLATYGVWNTFGVRRMGTKLTKLPVKTARPVAGFILTEADTIADDTNKAGTTGNCEAEVIAVLLNVSLQLLQDSEFDLTSDVLEDFAEALAFRLDYACLQADGTADATNGGMTGIFPGGTAAAAAAGNITTETTDYEDWLRCITTVDPAVLTRPARWWIHPQILARALAIKDLNGRPIFQTALEAPTFGLMSLLGFPVTPAFAAPSTNAANAKIAAFGDPKGLVVGVRQDFTMEASDHHKWNTLQRSFRGYGRGGVKIRRSQAFAVLTLPAA